MSKAVNLYNLKNQTPVQEDDDFIFVKSNLKNRKVFLGKLKYIQALGDYVKFVTEKDNFVVLATMKSFEEQLPNERFLRTHKSYIVNLEKIERIVGF